MIKHKENPPHCKAGFVSAIKFVRHMPRVPKMTEFIYCIKDHVREMQFNAFFDSGKRPKDEVFAAKT